MPQAKLVIEIDGFHHDLNPIIKKNDEERDTFLKSKGFTTFRITTKELGNGTYIEKTKRILNYLQVNNKSLDYYKKGYEIIKNNQISIEEITTKLLPTAIMRFQILLIELLIHEYLTFDDEWNFNIYISNPNEIKFIKNIVYQDELFGLVKVDNLNAIKLAINDLFIWINKLWQLKNKQKLKTPKFSINITNDKTKFQSTTTAINIDFSLFKRYTDENEINKDIIFIRTDYFDFNSKNNITGIDKNYFRVSTTEPINYKITDEDEHLLEFFLYNIFNKPDFRDGQFAIISNALNRNDTIGLLPTGGGKSLCYQLPCLLQPSINFVICPIKSLMRDQNDNLVKELVTNVNFITSNLDIEERSKVENNFEQGRYLFVWISPEKFQIPSFRDKIRSIVNRFSIAYAVVDEVHCLSEWGHDFRISYLNLAKTIDNLSPKDEKGQGEIKFVGLTATASVHVLKDIKIEFSRQKQSLEDENIKSLLDYSRKELQFEVINDKGNKETELKKLLKELNDTGGLFDGSEKAGLVFTPYVNGAYGSYSVYNKLAISYPKKVNWYSGSVPKRKQWIEVKNEIIENKHLLNEEIKKWITTLNLNFDKEELYEILYENRYSLEKKRKSPTTSLVEIKGVPILNSKEFSQHRDQVHKDFKEDEYQLLVSTKAFGMGIDKDNIFYTFHYGLPSSVEALYQEAGRAGRWDTTKKENKNKVGKCYILHSPETCDKELVEQLFNKNTTFSNIKAITDSLKMLQKRDVFRQIFLFTQGQNDIEKDFKIITGVINKYFKENSRVIINWKNAQKELGIKNNILEKAIYRLSLLGIVSDWTTNFINHYEVKFESLDDNKIISNISNHIRKYDAAINVKLELEKTDKTKILDKAILYLLKWTFNHIVYNRKQSLKTLYDWCSQFEQNGGSEEFKRRIDNYFIFTDTTFILQDITENPNKSDSWFDALFITVEKEINGEKKESKIHIPQIENVDDRKLEYEKLRDSISRFLESYRNSAGLNFVSGFVRLALNDYENGDGKERFESALLSVRNDFNQTQKKEFLSRLKELGKYLSTEQKEKLVESIKNVKYDSQIIEEFAEEYDLAHLLNDIYAEKLKELKILNNKLYEQLKEI